MILLPGETVKHTSETVSNKEDGVLYFTTKRLAWCKAGSETPAIEILHENFRIQQVSKAEAKKVMLRIYAVAAGSASDASPSIKPTFTWKTADKDAAIAEREKYVGEYSVITNRRAQQGGGASGQQGAQQPTQQQQQRQQQGTQGGSEAGGEATGGEGESNRFGNVKIGAVPASAEEIKLREEVLAKNIELSKVHKSLVVSGLISEDEFWSTRKHILETQAIQSQLRKGETSAWLDLTPSTQESGNFKYTITPNIARRIFKEFPQVKRAYVDNVPHKVSEKVFWKRFVASQFLNRGRSSDSSGRGSRDPIFDRCTQEEDVVFGNSARFDFAYLSRLLDLTRTEEDSMETGNAPDFTMRPTTRDSKLSLIRRFNHHSELVLQSVLNSKRGIVLASDHKAADRALEQATTLSDLREHAPEKRVKLNIQDRSRYFTSLVKEENGGVDILSANSAKPTDSESIRAALRVNFDIARPLDGCGDPQTTMASMLGAVHKLAAQSRPNRIEELGIPEEITTAIAECHGAGTEMLRHLWALLRLPLTVERRQKAEKIVNALAGVENRIRETIIRANAIESKNAALGATVERMLQPITDSLESGKAAFTSRMRGDVPSLSHSSSVAV
ncbi:RNA polymerase II transcription factor B subunit 1 [Coemansia sp. Benny D160-2]|nr:RNA polymerase II transcription factor B subunit 1 [Coemansia sp. Benny D160-2]